jgi:poly(3-hydroxybutyrate) depolymerase
VDDRGRTGAIEGIQTDRLLPPLTQVFTDQEWVKGKNLMKHDAICLSRVVSTSRSADYRFVVLLVGLLVCAGCGGAGAGNRISEKKPKPEFTVTMRHEGIQRTYHIHLPPGFKKEKQAPLVIALHGGGGKGSKFDQSTTQGTLIAAADKRGIVLVFPEGVNKQWSDGRTEIMKKKTYDDVGFISRIIDTMLVRYR